METTRPQHKQHERKERPIVHQRDCAGQCQQPERPPRVAAAPPGQSSNREAATERKKDSQEDDDLRLWSQSFWMIVSA